MLATNSPTLRADTIESVLMPGAVIEGHADLEKKCTNCHNPGVSKRADESKLCLDCHEKVQEDVKKKQGFHGRSETVSKQACRTCHTDHKGRDYDIIKLNPQTFDHHLTDFELRGGHTRVTCGECHKPKKKFREAPGTCFGCHEEESPHQERLGELNEKCDSCHSEKNWADMIYDHDKTKFKLTGKHDEATCVACHPNDRYEKTPRECMACHRLDDVHRGTNGERCELCHTTRAWDKLNFDHNQDTDFPLVGRHKGVTCRQCHRDDPDRVNIQTNCYSCHKPDDNHKGRFGTKCRTCHEEKGWEFTTFKHDRDTDFKLKGGHKKTKCVACHTGHVYNDKLETGCYACHKVDDVHRGQQGKQCQRCHNEVGWHQKVRFDHDLTRFPLLGTHAVTPCEDCHLSSAYRDTKSDCNNCHKEDDDHKRKLGENCERCHNPNGWKLWRFDHNREAEFEIDGEHTEVHCHSCHNRAVKKVLSKPRSCVACHRSDDEHNGRFGPNCKQCHTTESFTDIKNFRR